MIEIEITIYKCEHCGRGGKMYKYELQRYESNPHGHVGNLTKNMTYHPMRWKGIAQSDDIHHLRKVCLYPIECRIVDNETLEIFSCKEM